MVNWWDLNSSLQQKTRVCSKKTGITLRITKKNFEDEELLHELFLTTRQRTKVRNIFVDIMSKYIKLSIAQLSKII